MTVPTFQTVWVQPHDLLTMHHRVNSDVTQYAITAIKAITGHNLRDSRI